MAKLITILVCLAMAVSANSLTTCPLYMVLAGTCPTAAPATTAATTTATTATTTKATAATTVPTTAATTTLATTASTTAATTTVASTTVAPRAAETTTAATTEAATTEAATTEAATTEAATTEATTEVTTAAADESTTASPAIEWKPLITVLGDMLGQMTSGTPLEFEPLAAALAPAIAQIQPAMAGFLAGVTSGFASLVGAASPAGLGLTSLASLLSAQAATATPQVTYTNLFSMITG